MADSLSDAQTEIIKHYLEQMEYTILGAWMAGYDAVDVITEYGTLQDHEYAGEGFAFPPLKMKFRLIENAHQTGDYPRSYKVERYDLRGIDPNQVQEWRRQHG